MILVILFTLIGLFLMSKRIRQVILVITTIKQRMKQEEQLYTIHSHTIFDWGFLLICVCALIFIVTNINDPTTTALWILVFCISIGEFVHALCIKYYYYDRHGFYYYHNYVLYREIKELSTAKGFLGLSTMYTVKTTHGDLFAISKPAYEHLKNKGKSKH